MLAPIDLQLPVPSWRKWQPAIVERAIEHYYSGKRFVADCLPPGSGKSMIALGLGRMLQEMLDVDRVAVITSTKGLQDQYMKDAAPLGMVDIRGKANYECHTWPGYDCEQAWPMCGARKDIGCRSYKPELEIALSSRFVVTNYDYWCRVPVVSAGVGLLVLDEAHDADDAVCEALSVTVTSATWEWLGLRFEQPVAGGELEQAFKYCAEVTGVVERLSGAAMTTGRLHMEDARKLVTARRLMDGLGNVALDGNWVGYGGAGDKSAWVKYSPIWAGKYTEGLLFQNVPRVFLCSATLRKRHLGMLGVRNDDVAFAEHDAVFDADRRTVVWVRTARLNYSNMNTEWPKVMRRIEEMVRTRAVDGKRKGIIHTGSYDRARRVLVGSKYKALMVGHEDAKDRADAVERFMRSKGGGKDSVLVSPSVGTGYDFAHDLARWQVITKVPFVESKNPVTKARCEKDKSYAMALAMTELVQTCGRVVRDETDWGETVILDDNIGWFMNQNGYLAPKWFKVAALDNLPQMMPEGGW